MVGLHQLTSFNFSSRQTCLLQRNWCCEYNFLNKSKPMVQSDMFSKCSPDHALIFHSTLPYPRPSISDPTRLYPFPSDSTRPCLPVPIWLNWANSTLPDPTRLLPILSDPTWSDPIQLHLPGPTQTFPTLPDKRVHLVFGLVWSGPEQRGSIVIDISARVERIWWN